MREWREDVNRSQSNYHSFTILVPAYQDYRYVKAKINNLMALKYPSSLVEIIFIKGGCQAEQSNVLHAEKPMIKVVQTKITGKTNQLNLGFYRALGEIIMVTDIDAVIPQDTLLRINAAMQDKSIACVGTVSEPRPAHVIDAVYWQISNALRILESRYYSASHVVATCYAIRRFHDNASNAMSIPRDVIADDVFIPMAFNANGYKTKILEDVKVIESRNPSTMRELVKHKGRKGNALLRELLRMVYRLPEFNSRFKLIFMLRLSCMILACGLAYPFIKQDSVYQKVR